MDSAYGSWMTWVGPWGISGTWPSCAGWRHVPDSPQTALGQMPGICFSGQQVGWGLGGTGGRAGTWCGGWSLCWACSQTLGLSRYAEPEDTLQWFSLPCLRILDSRDPSCCPGFGHGTEGCERHTSFLVVSAIALLPGQVVCWPVGGSKSALLCIIHFTGKGSQCTDFMLQVMRRHTTVCCSER